MMTGHHLQILLYLQFLQLILLEEIQHLQIHFWHKDMLVLQELM